jgi:hypothetical protein
MDYAAIYTKLTKIKTTTKLKNYQNMKMGEKGQ